MNTDRFSYVLTAADGNNIVTLLDFPRILAFYEQFKIDCIVEHAIVLEDLHCKVGLFTILEAGWENTNALASPAVIEAARAKIMQDGQKIYLQILTARENGPWVVECEEIIQNKNSLEQPWALIAPAFGTNETALLGESLKIGIRIANKAQGVGGLKGTDYLRIFGSWRKQTKIELKKKDNDIKALQDRISALETLLGTFGAPSINLPGSNGLVPAPPAGGGEFLLRGDRSWENPIKFVDSSDTQDVGGKKYFTNSLSVGIDAAFAIQQYNNANIQIFNAISSLNIFSGSFTATSPITSTFVFTNTDVEIGAANTNSLSGIAVGQQLRARNFGSGLIGTLQGGRFTALNSGGGTVTNLDGGYFLARNDSTGLVTTLTGGQFFGQAVAGTVTNVNGGKATASANAASTVQTVRGFHINVSSSNTVPATVCVGLEIDAVTGTATNKYSLRTGAGQAYFGDTTQSISVGSGSALFLGGIGIAGNVYSGGIIQATQFQVGGIKVLGASETGWTLGTGTPNKGNFAADTATLQQTAQRLLAVEQALRNHGLIRLN